MVTSQKGLSSYEKKYDAKLPKLYETERKQTFNILEELKKLKFKKKKNILVQCDSIFTSSTLYFLTNITIINERVSISILVSPEKNHFLKSQRLISEDVVLMFYEIYLQKCEKYCDGEIVRANENNQLRIKRKCPLDYLICSRAKH